MRQEVEVASNSLRLVGLQVDVMVFQVAGGCELLFEVAEMSVEDLMLLLRVKEVEKEQEADFERLALRIARCRRS